MLLNLGGSEVNLQSCAKMQRKHGVHGRTGEAWRKQLKRTWSGSGEWHREAGVRIAEFRRGYKGLAALEDGGVGEEIWLDSPPVVAYVCGGMPTPSASANQEFAVVDVETTGLFPYAHDRIIEIAVVSLDAIGTPLAEFVTIVNPQRDVGPTRIHGLSARDVLNAPLFEEIAGDVECRLKGNVFVAHNARFDHDFVSAEFARMGKPLPPIPTLCTMRLAGHNVDSLASFSLDSLCNHFEIEREQAHCALEDARATARLLSILIASLRSRRQDLHDFIQGGQPSSFAWPDLAPSGRVLTREYTAKRPETSYLARLVEALPTTADPDGADSHMEYFDLLNRVLEDRRVTEAEVGSLHEVATRWGLTKEHARSVHVDYLAAIVEAALEDGVVTEAERADLDEVARLLGFDSALLTEMLDLSRNRRAGQSDGATQRGENQLRGQSVCFTGESRLMFGGAPLARATAESLAAETGMVVKSSVTKGLDLLVTADADSLSGKAEKARKYGTRVIAETVFWRLVGLEMK